MRGYDQDYSRHGSGGGGSGPRGLRPGGQGGSSGQRPSGRGGGNAPSRRRGRTRSRSASAEPGSRARRGRALSREGRAVKFYPQKDERRGWSRSRSRSRGRAHSRSHSRSRGRANSRSRSRSRGRGGRATARAGSGAGNQERRGLSLADDAGSYGHDSEEYGAPPRRGQQRGSRPETMDVDEGTRPAAALYEDLLKMAPAGWGGRVNAHNRKTALEQEALALALEPGPNPGAPLFPGLLEPEAYPFGARRVMARVFECLAVLSDGAAQPNWASFFNRAKGVLEADGTLAYSRVLYESYNAAERERNNPAAPELRLTAGAIRASGHLPPTEVVRARLLSWHYSVVAATLARSDTPAEALQLLKTASEALGAGMALRNNELDQHVKTLEEQRTDLEEHVQALTEAFAGEKAKLESAAVAVASRDAEIAKINGHLALAGNERARLQRTLLQAEASRKAAEERTAQAEREHNGTRTQLFQEQARGNALKAEIDRLKAQLQAAGRPAAAGARPTPSGLDFGGLHLTSGIGGRGAAAGTPTGADAAASRAHGTGTMEMDLGARLAERGAETDGLSELTGEGPDDDTPIARARAVAAGHAAEYDAAKSAWIGARKELDRLRECRDRELACLDTTTEGPDMTSAHRALAKTEADLKSAGERMARARAEWDKLQDQLPPPRAAEGGEWAEGGTSGEPPGEPSGGELAGDQPGGGGHEGCTNTGLTQATNDVAPPAGGAGV